jgi:hypothetical protein
MCLYLIIISPLLVAFNFFCFVKSIYCRKFSDNESDSEQNENDSDRDDIEKPLNYYEEQEAIRQRYTFKVVVAFLFVNCQLDLQV